MRYVLAVLMVLPAAAAPKWVARAAVAASCAASAADAVTTWQGARLGMTEANPLFRSASGTPAMGRVIGFKVGLCAASIWAEERGSRAWWTVAAHGATAGWFGWVAKHNEDLIHGK